MRTQNHQIFVARKGNGPPGGTSVKMVNNIMRITGGTIDGARAGM